VGPLVIEPEARKVLVGEQVLNLTRKEFDLLLTLAASPGKVFQREKLLDLIWGYDFYGEVRVVDTCVARLREKLRQAGLSPFLVATVWGVGYKLEV